MRLQKDNNSDSKRNTKASKSKTYNPERWNKHIRYSFLLLIAVLFLVTFTLLFNWISLGDEKIEDIGSNDRRKSISKNNGEHVRSTNASKIDVSDSTYPYPEWCPGAVCNDRYHCQPCKRRYLFILAQARSGSTTLKNMINLLPGVRIRGEITRSRYLDEMAKSFIDINLLGLGSDGKLSSVFGHHPYPENHFLCTSQSFVEELNPPESTRVDDSSTIVGFKEVRIKKDTMKFLMNNFPCSRFIFNIRSNETAMKLSRESNFPKYGGYELVPIYYETLLKKYGKKRVYLMDVDKWMTGIWHFTNLARWLGFKNCQYTGKIRHDNVNGYELDDGVSNKTAVHCG